MAISATSTKFRSSQRSLSSLTDDLKAKYPPFRTRLARLGVPSLLSLLFGGILLILISINALAGPRKDRDGKFTREDAIRFRYGSLWSLQVWIAVTGAGFGLLAYGYSEAYAHLFDWWCSRQARSDAGLDYGRYLNTLPRAPVIYGVRGYPVFATLKYALSALTIGASVGYKFGLLDSEAVVYRNLQVSDISHSNYLTIESAEIAADQPWFTDRFPRVDKRSFQYRFEQDTWINGPDEIMAAASLCPRGFRFGDEWFREGRFTSRDIVLLAKKSKELGNFTMSRDDENWVQVETSGTRWFGEERQDRAVVQYRSPETGKIQVQWGKLGSWYTDANSTKSEPVVERVTYTTHYAVAEVGRSLMNDGCSTVSDPTFPREPPWATAFGGYSELYNTSIFSVDDSVAAGGDSDAHAAMKELELWINALISAENTERFHGVSAVVRAFMNTTIAGDWDAGRAVLGPLLTEEKPFGQEDDSKSQRLNHFPFLAYPYFLGDRGGRAVGCHMAAAVIFLVTGIFSIAAMITRVVAGPAEITSWTAQHLCLSRAGTISMDDGHEKAVSSGYGAAPAGFGRLKIGKPPLSKGRDSSESESLVRDTPFGRNALERFKLNR